MARRNSYIPAAVLAALLLAAGGGSAQVTAPNLGGGQQRDRSLVEAKLVADAAAVAPGGHFTIGLLLKIKPDWHVYWINPGDSGIPTRVRFTSREELSFGPLRWPVPVRFEMPGGIVGYGYERRVLFGARVSVPESVEPGQTIRVEAKADWLACKVSCVPGEARKTLTIPVREQAEPAREKLFTGWRRRLPVEAGAPGSPVRGVDRKQASNGGWRLALRWTEPAPQAVDFYPAPGDRFELNDLRVEHEGPHTTVRYRLAERGEDGPPPRGLAVYNLSDGERRGVWVTLRPETTN